MGVFLARGSMGHSVDSFMELLLQKYPTINIDFTVTYPQLLHYTTEVFIHKRQIPKTSPLFEIAAPHTSAALQSKVNFVDDYDAFKSQNMVTQDETMTDILEDCKFKLSSLSHTFVELIMEESPCKNYNSAVKLKSVLINNLKGKSIDLVCALSNNDKQGWFKLLVIDNPCLEDLTEWDKLVREWRLAASRVTDQAFLESLEPGEDEPITALCKRILQNKVVVSELCKLVIYITSTNV